MSALIPEDLTEWFESGVGIAVGTRDSAMVSEVARASGAVVHRDRQRVTIFIPTLIADRTVTHLRDNGQIAVGFSNVFDHRTIQLKGRVEEIRHATEEERAVIDRYHAAFGEILFGTGIPRAVGRRWRVWPSTAVTFLATDIFEQTPGPKAGQRFTP